MALGEMLPSFVLEGVGDSLAVEVSTNIFEADTLFVIVGEIDCVSDAVLLVDEVAQEDPNVVCVTLVVKLFRFADAETDLDAVGVIEKTGVLDLHAVAEKVIMTGVTEELAEDDIELVEQSVVDVEGDAVAHVVIENVPDVDSVGVSREDQDMEYVGVIVVVTDPVSLCRLDLEFVSERVMVFVCVVEIVALEEPLSHVVGDAVALDDADCDRVGDEDGVSDEV